MPPLPDRVVPFDLCRPRSAEIEGGAAAWLLQHECHAALLRPDHYVFGTAADAQAILALPDARRAALA
ncbi:MAG: hypothetical protein ABIO45_05715 [Burkholderiaceae bacterium]